MLTIAFEKTQNSVFVAHTDILRSLNRTFRRAGINVGYSKGFNRHMSLKLTQPLPFGVASKEEWVTADTDFADADLALRLFNENCPPSLKASRAFVVKANPNLGGKVVASDYKLYSPEAINHKEEIINAFNNLEIGKKGSPEEKINATHLIYKADVDEEGIYVLSAFGNKNVRMDMVAAHLNALFNLDIEVTDIIRLTQYVETDGKLISAEEYVRSLI